MAERTIVLDCTAVKKIGVLDSYAETVTGVLDRVQRYFSFSFSDIPDNLKRYQLLSAKLRVYLKATTDTATFKIGPTNRPKSGGINSLDNFSGTKTYSGLSNYSTIDLDCGITYSAPVTQAGKVRDAINNWVSADWSASTWVSFYATGTEHPPQLVITYDDAVVITSQVRPTNHNGGYADPSNYIDFSWSYFPTPGDYAYRSTFTQQSAIFYWKESTAQNYTSVNITWQSPGARFQPNYFPSGKIINFYVTGTDTEGTTSTSQVYWFSTTDSETTATPVSPSNTIEDGSSPITFTWTTANPNGTAPTGADLQYSTDGTTWTTFGTVTGSATTYTASPGIPGGTVQWRVRAKNADGVAGPWSSALSFVSIAAPAAPVVNYDGTPLSTVSWQGTGQVAYEVRIDGVLVKSGFGSVMSYTLEEPLSDGEHVIAVRIQSSLGLWSENGLSTFIVQNTPGTAVTLEGAFGIDASLAWTGDGIVYRDGAKIGTGNGSYVDRLALGEHSYYVIVPTGDGNYTQSNTVTGLMAVERAVIDLANASRGWMQLRLTQNSDDLQAYTYTRASQQFHITATALPVIEISKYEDESVTLNTAFTDPAEIEAFEALRGKVVIVKARGNNVIVGGMVEVQKEVGDFFTNFSFTINRIHWEGV